MVDIEIFVIIVKYAPVKKPTTANNNEPTPNPNRRKEDNPLRFFRFLNAVTTCGMLDKKKIMLPISNKIGTKFIMNQSSFY